MSNKTHTPIQQAIEERQAMIAILTEKRDKFFETDNEYQSHQILIGIVQNGIDNLTLLLPAERKFAEECFDAGYDKGKDDYSEIKNSPFDSPNF